MTKRLVTRLVMGVLALVMAFAAFVCGHAAAWYWLSGFMDRPYAALVLTGVDLLLAITFVLLAARSSPSRVEREARAVRQQVLTAARQSMALSTMVARLGARLIRSQS